MPPITLALIVLNVLIYILSQVTGPNIVQVFGLWPPGSSGAFHFWQLITYSFLHGGLLHLGFNMLAIGMFGAPLERRYWLLGRPRLAAPRNRFRRVRMRLS